MEAADQLWEGPSKRLMIEMAAAWIRLAEHVENNPGVYLLGTPASPSELPQVRQQQQQARPKG